MNNCICDNLNLLAGPCPSECHEWTPAKPIMKNSAVDGTKKVFRKCSGCGLHYEIPYASYEVLVCPLCSKQNGASTTYSTKSTAQVFVYAKDLLQSPTGVNLSEVAAWRSYGDNTEIILKSGISFKLPIKCQEFVELLEKAQNAENT
jgi:hypothetical protein